MLKILLVCVGGMSSSLVTNAMIKAGAKAGIEIDGHACGLGEYDNTINSKDWDGILVSPQVKFNFEPLKKVADEKGIPIVAIKPQAYTPMGGDFLMAHIKEMGLI